MNLSKCTETTLTNLDSAILDQSLKTPTICTSRLTPLFCPDYGLDIHHAAIQYCITERNYCSDANLTSFACMFTDNLGEVST